MYEKPMGWKEFSALAFEERLDAVLRIRLVEIAFTESGSTAVKAVELLRSMPIPEIDADLSQVSTEVLLEAQRRAKVWLESDEFKADNGQNGSQSD
jgi:hypothetical protein